MNSEYRLSFVNGFVAGAGGVLSIMATAFLYITSPLEGKAGFTTTDIRIAIFLGAVIFGVSVCYEMFRKKDANFIDDKNKQKTSKGKNGIKNE